MDIIKLRKCRDKARKKYLKSNHVEHYENFRNLRHKVKQQIRNDNVRYFHSIFDGNPNPKKMWSTIRSLGISNNAIRNVKEYPVSADSLNEHYLNVSSVDDENLARTTLKGYEDLPECERELFHFKYVTPEEIRTAINSITSSAVGVDGIPVSFLKLMLDEILVVLVHIFNHCLQSGVFPSIWKSANIIPLPKGPNPTVCKDFRPVSILCALSKALEKVIHSQVCDYITSNRLINKFQSGFRKGHSTTTVLKWWTIS